MQVGSVLILSAKPTFDGRKEFAVFDKDEHIVRKGTYDACKGLIDGRSDKFMGQHPFRPEAVKALKALRKRLVNG